MSYEENPKYRRAPNYTTEQIKQKYRIEKILKNIRCLQRLYDDICASCNHVIPKPPLLNNFYTSLPAICDICKTKVGRMCYYSLDNVCHFDVVLIDDKPSIKLHDGTIYRSSSRFPDIQHSQRCLFCEEFEDRCCC